MRYLVRNSLSFLMLMSVVFANELIGGQSKFPLSVLPGGMVLGRRATFTSLNCSFAFTESCLGRLWCRQTIYGIVCGPPLSSLFRSTSLSRPLDDNYVSAVSFDVL